MMWESPYLEKGEWLRGNTHTHSTVSDGSHSPQEVIDIYGRIATSPKHPWNNYRWLVLTDHNKETFPENFEIPEKEGFVVMIGREESWGKHIVGINCEMTFEQDIHGMEMNSLEYHQARIDKMVDEGGMVILPHPHWASMDHWSAENAIKLERYTGIELINGDIWNGPGYLATDVWDAALTAGKRVWGFGADDFHSVRDFHNAWTTVYARECTKDAILEAIKCGSLYASNGADFERLYVDGDWIIAEAKDTNTTVLTEKTFKFIGAGGEVLHRQIGTGRTAAYKAQGREKYVRVELQLGWGGTAWSSPFFWTAPESE